MRSKSSTAAAIPIFETPRLILRAPIEGDIPAYQKHFNDYEVIGPLAAIVPWPYPETGVRDYLMQAVFPNQGQDHWFWGIFEKERPSQLIGSVQLWRVCRPENRGFWLGRPFWGKGYMTEAVTPVMDFAFDELDFEKLIFANAVGNEKSQRVKVKTGARLIDVRPGKFVDPAFTQQEIWELTKTDWLRVKLFDCLLIQKQLETLRFFLEPITVRHALELYELFSDPELHRFVPSEPSTLEKMTERCRRWESRKSSDGTELWLNWAVRDRLSRKIVAHLQGALKKDGEASVAYTVARSFQGQGIAGEGLDAVFAYLHNDLSARQVKVWSDTRNLASHAVAKKMGLEQIDYIRNADFFKGENSDEYVFAKRFQPGS